MAAIDQSFVTYKGDAVSPIFTVRDSSGNPVDISTVSEITWIARLLDDSDAALTLTKTGGGIVFVTDGTDGKFRVSVTGAQTAALDGWYMHVASIADSAGNTTTVTVGRFQVGLKPSWCYNAAAIATRGLYQVRRLIGDVIADDQQLQDEEIEFFLTLRANIYGAAAEACRSIASQYSRKVDTVAPGEIRTAYSQQAKNYSARAIEFENRSNAIGGGFIPYAGGISVQDKIMVENDPDRVTPQFNLGMMDNELPIGPVGHETPSSPQSGVGP